MFRLMFSATSFSVEPQITSVMCCCSLLSHYTLKSVFLLPHINDPVQKFLLFKMVFLHFEMNLSILLWYYVRHLYSLKLKILQCPKLQTYIILRSVSRKSSCGNIGISCTSFIPIYIIAFSG